MNKYIKKVFLKILNSPFLFISYFGQKGYFRWIPDELYIKIIYRASMKQKLNLEKPTTFNEKIQWLKLYDDSGDYTELVDKFLIRNYIENEIGKEYLVPLYGVWEGLEEMNFEELNSPYVLKTTHDSGSVFFVDDNSDINDIQKKIRKSLNSNYYYVGREKPYKYIKPRIIAEKNLKESKGKSINDYKVYCFNGKPKLIQVISNRTQNKFDSVYMNTNWYETDILRNDTNSSKNIPPEPYNLQDMLLFSKKLAKNIPFVRIDFYEVKKKLYFGEMTFYPGNGMINFSRKEDDIMLGKWIELPKKGEN